MIHYIVKYSNRKLYSKKYNNYLKLEDILSLIKQGERISVQTKEGVEITSQIKKSLVTLLDLSDETVHNLLIKGEIYE